MAGARPLELLRLTTGIAFGTLLLTGTILLTPTMNACGRSELGLAACLQQTLVDRRLLPPPPTPGLDVVEQVVNEAPPSVEVAPEPGTLSVVAPIPGADAPPSIELHATGTIEGHIAARPDPTPPANANLLAGPGTLAASPSMSAPPGDVAALIANGGIALAWPDPKLATNDARAAFESERASIIAKSVGEGIDPITTGTLSSPQMALHTASPPVTLPPPMLAPLRASSGAFATSTPTSTVENSALADLSPLAPADPPPLPRRRDDQPPIEDEIPAEPPLVADDPQFPSVTLMPPPVAGENSSIVTLTLEF